MNRSVDIERILDDWLAQGPEELPDPVLDRVANEIEEVGQQGRAWPFGDLSMNRSLIAGALAGAIVALVIGLGMLSLRNTGGPAPTPSSGPVSLIGTEGQVLEPGTYRVDEPFPVRISFDLPAGWKTYPVLDEHLAAVCKGFECELGLSFWVIENLPVDGCRPELGEIDPPVGPTVADLAVALVTQPGYEATGPADSTMSGYSGAYLELTGQGIPAGGCSIRTTWETDAEFRRSLHEEHDSIWILDVDGTRLVVDAFAIREATERDRTELRQMVESIRIEAP